MVVASEHLLVFFFLIFRNNMMPPSLREAVAAACSVEKDKQAPALNEKMQSAWFGSGDVLAD